MRAFLLTGHGGLDRHRFVTGWPIPEPGPKEVRVHACGLNTVDVNTRVGRYAREVQAPTQGRASGWRWAPGPAGSASPSSRARTSWGWWTGWGRGRTPGCWAAGWWWTTGSATPRSPGTP